MFYQCCVTTLRSAILWNITSNSMLLYISRNLQRTNVNRPIKLKVAHELGTYTYYLYKNDYLHKLSSFWLKFLDASLFQGVIFFGLQFSLEQLVDIYCYWIEFVVSLSRAQFHGAAKHKILLSLKMFCLANKGYQPKSHAMFISPWWFSAKFC